MKLVRRAALIVFFSLLALRGAAQNIASADLQIQGVGLRVVNVSVTTGLDIPASVQTEFGGRQNDEAPAVEGLVAVGELDGPGIELPIRLETAPGHRFTIPGLSREGIYFLRNIRLMKGTEFLQSATPSVATITVSNLLQTAVKVRQLTPEELRARGITIDARNYEVFEYTFSFFIDDQLVEIPYPVVVDKRTREVRPLPKEEPWLLPPIQNVTPPRWTPPAIETFELGPGPDLPQEQQAPAGGGGGGRPSIPAALVIPNNLAVLHQFFAVTLMVTNGAPEGSSVVLDGVTAMIRTPTDLRVVKSVPAAAFNQPIPVVDASNGVTFLVAQAKGNVDWTVEGLEPGTHTLEVEVRATYKSPGQADFPLKGTVRASVVVHDPRFNITFSHPDTVRKGIDYSTYSFITNMSPVAQTIRVSSGVQTCEQSPLANICQVDDAPQVAEVTIAAGEMRMIEYKLRPSVTGSVFATAGTVSDDDISAAVQLHMGVSESGIPLSPATLVMPHYAQFVDQELVEANLQLLGLGYSLATAPLTQVLAKHPKVIKTDVFLRAVDIARAGQHVFLGEEPRDAMAHLSLDLLANAVELREWDELRRREKSGRTAGASVARQLEKDVDDVGAFVDRFAQKTAHRNGYVLALLHGPAVPGNERPYALSVRGVTSNRRLQLPNEAEEGWIRELAYADLSQFHTASRAGELAMIGRWSEPVELSLTPSVAGPHTLELIYPNAADGTLLRATIAIEGQAGRAVTVTLNRGEQHVTARDDAGGIVTTADADVIEPEPLRLVGSRQDLHLDPNAHKVSVLFNRPASIAEGDDWLAKFHGQIILNKDGVDYTGARPISSAALQDSKRVVNLTFDHALSQNASYSIAVDPVRDPLSGAPVSFPQALTPVIDNDEPGGIIFGHVLKGDNSPIAGAEVVLTPEEGAPQYDTSRDPDGSFLFEFVARDVDNQISGAYSMYAITSDDKVTRVEGAVRLPGRVHFVNLVFLGRGSAEGFVRYDNGQVVPGARVTVGSTMFDQFRTTETDATGFYRVEDLPVGPLTLSATDDDGNVTFAASEIRTPGQVLVKDLSIFRRPFPGVGVIRGIVKRSDTGAPVPNAHVGVYSQGYGLLDDFTDAAGRFEFTEVPTGFVTVLAAEWTVSRESVALDFDLAPDERRDLVLTLNVAPDVPLVTIEGDVIRENPLFPGDPSKYERVAGALVKLDKGQVVTADANGHYVIPSVPASAAGKDITGYDPLTTRSRTIQVPALSPNGINNVPIFIDAASGQGTGTVRVRVLSATGIPVTGLRVIEPGFPPTEFTETSGGVYLLKEVPVGRTVHAWAISGGGPYGDQFTSGFAKVEFNGHVAALTLRLGGQGTVRVKLQADIEIIGDVDLTYTVWDETEQATGPKTVTANTAKNGLPDYAVFEKVPAVTQDVSVASVHPVYGHAGQTTKLAFDGDLKNITLQLNKLSTIRGVVYAIDGRTPIPGAAVRLEDGRQNQGIFTTLPDGSFVFHNVPASTSFRVIAEITQNGVYRTGVGSGTTPALGGPVDNVAVVMRTQGSIDGRVVYAAYKVYDPQNPANNVLDDTPNDLSDNAPVPLARFYLKELDFPRRDFGTQQETLGADILGRFSFNNIFTGPLRVSASDPGNQEMRGTWNGTLTQEGERITAIVALGGAGFGSATITVVDPNNGNAPVINAEVSLFRNSLFDFATTDGAGRVTFDQIPAGNYTASAYSKALGKSGGSGSFTVDPNEDTGIRIVLEFSGEVTGQLVDPENGNRGVPGAHVTFKAFQYDTRATTDSLGGFLFEGVREGQFTLDAKDTLSNRRAKATRVLTQADPRPNVVLELEPVETLHLSVYEPNDTGGNSNVLVPVVEATVRQRGDDFFRSLQGNSFEMTGVLENEEYKVSIKEIGGQHRELSTTASFPTGNASNPLKLVLPAYGTVRVNVIQAGEPAVNARVHVSGGNTNATVYTDNAGLAVATGIRLGNVSVQASTIDNAFSGSASATLSSQSTPAVVSITLGAFAGVTGYVEAELGGPSVGTRVVATWNPTSGGSRQLEMFTDSNGRYVFQGITTGSTVNLVYVGPDDITVGARQSYAVKAADASQTVALPNVKLDATPPQLVRFTPADGAQNVSPDTSLEFVFSETIQSQYINRNFIQLLPADSSSAVNATYVSFPQADGTFVVRVTPPPPAAGKPFPLESNTLYRIVVSGEIRDLTGNRMPGSRGSVFTTTDYAQPSVVKVTPSPATPLAAATIFQFQFNEPIDPAPWQTGGNGVFHLYKVTQPNPSGAVIREVPGRAFVDPESSLTLIFSPDEALEAQSYYRTVFTGVRDLQGNPADAQTFHFFSFDEIRPFVTLVSPVPAGFPLISGVEYTLTPVIRDTDANGAPSTDIARVDYLRVQGETATFLKSETKAPYAYRFVAPDVPESGGTFSLRAEALDLSGNTSEPANISWTVQPNNAPQNVTVTLAPPTSSYAGNRVHATVAFDDEGVLATVQVVLTGTQANGTPYAKSLVQQATRANVSAPWPTPVFDFDLPATLQEGSTATFTATVTDARGQATSMPATLTILEDLAKPMIVSLAPPAESRYPIGFKYQIEAVVQDLESGVQRVVFHFDGNTVTVLGTDPSVTPALQPRAWRFVSGQITVPAKNVDTRIPITVTAYDYHGNVQTHTVEIIYVGVNDPTVPKGAWLCPVDRAVLPANQAALPIDLQVRATDDIAVTGVKFVIPGIANPVAAARVGTTDVWQATASIPTPAEGTPFSISAVVSDANSEHDVTLPIAISLADADVFVDDRVQAITSADLATYQNKTIVVRGATARLVPHVPIALENLIILGGGKVETLSTTTTVEHKLDLTITGSLYIDCASSIDVTSRGYLGGWATSADGSGKNDDARGRTFGNTNEGGATTFSSASHGGVGGIDGGAGTTNATYGSIANPTALGAGGGGASNGTAGASGGGAIQLTGDTFAIAGAIRANGGDRFGSAHAGAGGSVNLSARQFITGPAARVSANGGDDDDVNNGSRGGGGGRVAVTATERFEVETLGLQLAARGGRNGTTNEGATYLDAGAGTVFVKRPGQTLGELFVGNFDERRPATTHLSRYTPISGANGTLRFDRVELGARALLRADSSIEINGAADDRNAVVAATGAVILFPNDQPSVTVTTAPLAGSSIAQGGTLSTTYSAASLAGIGTVKLAWTPVTPDRIDAFNGYPPTAAPNAIALAVPNTAATGPATLTVTATDRAERSIANAPLAFTIVANAPPVITKLEANPPSLYPGKSVTATVSATDDLGITKLTLTSTINNGAPATQSKTPNTAAVTDSTFTVAVPITTPGGAPMTLTAGVEDAFPGRTPATQTINVTILTDTVAPSLSVTAPAANTTYQEGTGALIQVRATATDAEVGVKQVYAQIDGGTQYPLTAGANGSWSADIPVPNVDGVDVVTRQLVVTAKDYQDNAAAAPAIPIQIRPLNDPNAPVAQWACSTSGAMYPAGYAAKLRVFAIGNDAGNAANGIQKVELFAGDSTTPILATAVTGLANHYEATYTIPSDAADGATISVRAVATNTAGLSSDVTTQLTVVAGTVLTANTTISATDTSYDGRTVIVQSGTLTVAGQHAFARLVVLGTAKVTHLATTAAAIERLTVSANALYVACDASIDVTGLGFSGSAAGFGRTWPNTTTGGSFNGAGGSHGGRGGAHDALGDSAPSYGSVFDPNTPGGAGGQYQNATCNPCNSGGGIARIAAQSLIVDGKVLANGAASSSGGGAGGSIRIDAGTLSGGGEVRADGGTAGQGAGGGGRVAIYYQSLALDRAKITAGGMNQGTDATRSAAAGTVYLQQVDPSRQKLADELVLDNLDRTAARFTTLPDLGTGTVTSVAGSVLTLSAPVPEFVEGSLLEIDGARYPITARTATTVTVGGAPGVTAGAAYRGVWQFDQVTTRRQGKLDAPILRTPLVSTTATGLVRAAEWTGTDVALRGRAEAARVTASSLSVQNGSQLAHAATTNTTVHTLTIDVDALTVDATSSIDVSGRGYTGSASGFGRTWSATSPAGVTTNGSFNGAGGSHGGRGGAHDTLGESAEPYGSVYDPATPGGAGGQYQNATCNPCNAGGGVVRITAETIALDGKLLANGAQSGSGGGAGGSIRIDANTVSGTGEIRADGGSGGHASGGGGRIAVYSRTFSFDRAKITAAGAVFNNNTTRTAGAGTIYFAEVGEEGSVVAGELLVDNRDRTTTRITPLFTAGTGTVTAVSGAVVTLSNPVPEWIEGSSIDFFDATGARVSQYRVLARTATTVTLDAASPDVSVGNTYRGVARFDAVTVRGAALVNTGALETPLLTSGTSSYIALSALRAHELTLRGWIKVDGDVHVPTLTLDSGATLEVDGLVKSTNLALTNGAKLTQLPTTSTEVTRLVVDATNLTVDAASSIDVSGRGYTGSASGFGRTWSATSATGATANGSFNGAGGSHGGRGGAHDALGDSAPAYGSVFDPNTPGGAGGQYQNATCNPCNSGGGIARITAETFTLDGKLLANGAASGSGGGAGGSIRIDAQSLSGTGEIRADGGSGGHAAGGGGRIALYVSDLVFDRTKITAAGALFSGNSARTSAAGTVYFGAADELLVDNLDRVSAKETTLPSAGTGTVTAVSGTTLTLSSPVPEWIEGSWIELDDAAAQILARTATTVTLGSAVAVQSGAAYRGSWRFAQITARRQGVLQTSTVLRVPRIDTTATALVRAGQLRGDDVTLRGRVETAGVTARNLALESGAFLTHPPATATAIHRLDVTVAQTLSVDATSSIDASGRGYTGATNGFGRTWPNLTTNGSFNGAGGSHGGRGGAHDAHGDSAATYGSLFDPSLPGGAGGQWQNATCNPCNAGGGVVRITANTVALDGKVLANGTVSSNGGGGAGGSIRIDANTVSGAGEIRADGGLPGHAAGGGGRIAVYYETLTLDRAKVLAVGGNFGGNATRTGAAGTVYLKQTAQPYGDLVIDNTGRSANHNTALLSVGFRTVTASGASFVRDAAAAFPSPDFLARVRLVLDHDTTTTWPIVSNDATTLHVDSSANALAAQNGQSFRGLYRFDNVRLRNARLEVLDLLESVNPIDRDAPSLILGSNRAPVLSPALIALQSTATGSSILGTAGAATDPDQPLVLTATNLASGNTFTVNANLDGSFALPLQGNAGDAVTLKARDSNFFPLESPVLSLGTLQFGTPAPSNIDKSTWNVDATFRSRRLAMDERNLVVYGGGSDDLTILGVGDPARPAFFRTVNVGNGAISDVAIVNGWAVIASNDLALLDLSASAATPVFVPDQGNLEMAVTVSGGYAYTATNNGNDGRIRIHDVSTPSVPRFVREQNFVSGLTWKALLSYGNYLIAISDARPNGIGHDVYVIDRTNLNALAKVADVDIPSFDATAGRIAGDRLYLTSATSRDIVIVDLSTPAAPTVLGRVTMPANGSRSAVVKTTAFVADTTSGLVEVDASNAAAPLVVGALATTGTAFDVEVAAPYAYVANDTGLAIVTVSTPPQVETSRIRMSAQGTSVVVTGGPRSILGSAPMTVVAGNDAQHTSGSANVAADGSFSVTLPALAGDAITLEVTDGAARSSGIVPLGRVPFGSGVASIPLSPALTGEANYRARTLATDGRWLIVGGAGETSSTRLLIFDVTDPAVPVFKRSAVINNGAINNVAIANGWAVIAANDLVLLDLGNPNSTPIGLADQGNLEVELLVRDGYAFTTTNNGNDGRIRIYEASSLPAARFIREQNFVSGATFTGLAGLGSRYLVAMTGDRPNGIGHDVVVIDRSNIHALVKVADLDIPSFNAYRGKVLGTTLYVAGTSGGLAVVDLADPTAPVVKTVLPQADARGVDAIGATVAVANGSAGVTLLHLGDPHAPTTLGTQNVGGSAWSVAFNGGNLYVANQQGIAVIQNIASAPMVDPDRVAITPVSGTLATIDGSANSVRGAAPLTVEVKNVHTGASLTRSVAPDGSFSVLLPAMVGENVTVEATDVADRVSGPVPVGSVPFGSAITSLRIDNALTGENYNARTLATDGRHLIVGGWNDTGSTKLIVYDVTNPDAPVFQRAVTLSNGAINNVAIYNGWAVIAANDLVLLDLNNPSSTPRTLPDEGNVEKDVLIAGGYAFTSTNNGNDGRIRVYDISRPDVARFVREQNFVSGATFSGLAALGQNYVVGITGDRPNGIGHDLVVLDRSNIHSMVKVADVDIPGFNAFRGKVVNTTLYLAGTSGGLAIVDLSNPASPQIVKVMATGGSPHGVDGAGGLLAIADGGSGVTFADVSEPAAARLIGTQRVGGHAWSLAFNRGNIYVVNDQGLVVIRDVGAAPVVMASLITVSGDGAGTATIAGIAQSISGSGTLTYEARNSRTGATVDGTVPGDGGFSIDIPARPGDGLTIEATDEAGRSSGRVFVGNVPFGALSSMAITPAMSGENNFRPRTLAADGKYLVVAGYADTGSTRLVVFDISQPGPPQFLRSVALGNGAIHNVALTNGWAVVAANDLVLVNLDNPAQPPKYLPDEGNAEVEVLVSGGFAFTATNNGNDGRIRVYDVSDPGTLVRFVREQNFVSGVTFSGLAALGSDYLVASTANRPNGIGHDVVVIDRRNVYAMAKVGDLDVPSFDGFRGRVAGTTLYLGGLAGGLAVVDLSNPAQPVTKLVLQTAGDAFGGDASGSTFAVADGGAGVTFLDISSPFAPEVIGTQGTGGTVWSVQFSRGAVYAVNEQGLVVIDRVAAPVIDRTKIALSTTSALSVSVTAAAAAIGGVAPFTATVRNVRTSAATGAFTVAPDGSFSVILAAVPNDPLELIVTDRGNRVSRLALGNTPFGATATLPAGPGQALGDPNYRARRIASDGTITVMGSGSYAGINVPGSNRVLLFRPGLTQFKTVNGNVNDLTISGSHAVVAAADLATLNLADPNTLSNNAADQGNSELSVAVMGNLAFTSTNNGNDGRIRIYNITNPAAPTFVREQSFVSGLTWTKILPLGTNYLIAISPERPNGIGHDLVLIDVTNPNAMVKLADVDVPGFDAFDGAIEGTTAYLVGGNGGIAVMDFTGTPVAPAFTTAILKTPGHARGVTVSGTREIAVADGSAGITFIDATNRTAPVLLGTHSLGGTNAVGVAATGRTIHVAADNQYHTITRP